VTARRSLRRVAWLAALAMVALIGSATAAHAESPQHPPIVLFAVPGLLWSDVADMPSLTALAAYSSVGELSVKTSGDTTRCGAGLLAVSAGNRTTSPSGGCAIDPSSWPSLRASNHDSRYAATIGGLGTALQTAGVTTVAVSSAAVPMLANATGTVDLTATSVASAIAAGGVIGVLDQGLYDPLPATRSTAARAVDGQLATIRRQLPADATLIVAGISDRASGNAQLHAIVISGPGWTHTQLRSSAVGRAPYVQLIDIAPTILAAEGISEPTAMVGRAMQRSGSSMPSIATYVDDNRHAVAQRTLGQRVFLALGIAVIVLMFLIVVPVSVGRPLARWVARLLAPAPALVFIANAFPWWRWGQPVFAGLVVAGCVVMAALTAFAARRSLTAGLLVVPVFSFAALAVDQLTGATLQLSAPLGDNPLIAGRFSGMGNLDFAVMATSALIVAGVVGASLPRIPAVLSAAAIAGVAVVIDGAPPLGNDIGGVLALLPAAIVVVALVARLRFTRLGVVAVALATVVVAVAVALADYSRPAANQTDVGRFVGQVLHGGAGTEIHRKLDAVFASVGWTIGTFVVLVAIAFVVLARTRIRGVLTASPGVRAAVAATVVVAALGVVLNDSGITIGAMAIIVVLSALYGAGLSSHLPDAVAHPAEPGGICA
jgi:hypothetical protein